MSLDGWVPVRVGQTEVEWRYLPECRFTDPFFEDTLRRNRAAPVRTAPIQEAAEWVAEHPGLTPSGMVFHMSRCGSTLVAQMLASIPGNRVMSEPPAVDEALRHGSADLLRTVVGALGQPAPGETRYFLKLDCWHINRFELFREAFPATPAVFLYRDPAGVLASQMRSPGVWTAQIGANREQRIAELLGAMMEAALQHADSLRLIEYTELPGAVESMFGIAWTDAEREQMRRASAYDAKTPTLEFRREKRAVSDAVRQSSERLAPVYERLRQLTAASR